jgi:hypothetical protein
MDGRIGHRTLAIADAVTDTARRARGVMGTQHSVQVADAGSNPAESILPLVKEELKKVILGRQHRDDLPK